MGEKRTRKKAAIAENPDASNSIVNATRKVFTALMPATA
jgi:hypothetical protein